MILLFSGPAAVGKSTACSVLEKFHGFIPIKSSSYLRDAARTNSREITRASLQEIGDQLDVDTDFKWLIEAVAKPQMSLMPNQQLWFVDSVRKMKQVQHFKNIFGSQVTHVHITASEELLKCRFTHRRNCSHTKGYEKTCKTRSNIGPQKRLLDAVVAE